MNLKSAVSITVKGKVQGVWYRASTKIKAEELQLNGFVKNLDNGDVYIETEGKPKAINALVEWCRLGPENAVVTDVLVEPISAKGYEVFSINR